MNERTYNVVINRLKAFCDGHEVLRRFSHATTDIVDIAKNPVYPWMHVQYLSTSYGPGVRLYEFEVFFSDLPRDKESKFDYQREIISDMARCAEDLINVINYGSLFGTDVNLVEPRSVRLVPFAEENNQTLTGVAISFTLEVPYEWNACDVPATFSTPSDVPARSSREVYFFDELSDRPATGQDQILYGVYATNLLYYWDGDSYVAWGGGGGSAPAGTGIVVVESGSFGTPGQLSGDVTTSGAGLETIIANDAVTNAKLANMPSRTLKGNNGPGNSDPLDLSAVDVKNMLVLSAVNNTADVDKPVSTAQATAIAAAQATAIAAANFAIDAIDNLNRAYFINAQVPQNTTRYFSPRGGALASGEATIQLYVDKAFTLSNFWVDISGAMPADNALVGTVRRSAGGAGSPANTAVTVSIPVSSAVGTRVEDSTNTVSFAVGDYISITLAKGAGLASATIRHIGWKETY